MPEADESTREHLRNRLEDLRREYANGETQLAALDVRRRELSTTMTRIAGAIQVLEEMLADS